MRQLAIQKSVIKDLQGLPAKQYRQVVSSILDLLKEPSPHNSKNLQGSPYMRLAVGEYRVIYNYSEDSVAVYAFGKRNDGEIYKKLSRMPNAN